jgi:hypothetical protein
MRQKNQHELSASAEQQERQDRRAKLIRLNDLIPKKDMNGGRQTVFGAVRARPDKQQQKEARP